MLLLIISRVISQYNAAILNLKFYIMQAIIVSDDFLLDVAEYFTQNYLWYHAIVIIQTLEKLVIRDIVTV